MSSMFLFVNLLIFFYLFAFDFLYSETNELCVAAEAESWDGSRYAVSSRKFWTTVTGDSRNGDDEFT